ncbi:MAG: VOC family protein [Mycetocola sp.]
MGRALRVARWASERPARDGRRHSPQDSLISVHVGNDVDEAFAEAQRRGYEIVHPLTDEPWGVRRFLVRDPDGNVINIVSHRDE